MLRMGLLFFCCFLVSAVDAQQIKVNGHFAADSVTLGKPIQFSLVAHYPEKLNVLFPDSAFLFAPFEYEKKIYFPTETKNGISRDSVIYTLTTFSIDSIQHLALPVWVVNPTDCLTVYSAVDTAYFKKLVKSIPDSVTIEKLPLKSNTLYLGVRWQLNTILMSIIGGGLLVVLIVAWVIFGKRIRRYFKLKRLTKNYEAFVTKFDLSIQHLESGFSPQHAEASLVIWKNYLESLLAKPYTKYTSREIKKMETNETLGDALTHIDQMIYGHARENIRSPFLNLKGYVQQQFEKKKEEVAHG